MEKLKNQARALEKKSRHTSSTVKTQIAPTPRPWHIGIPGASGTRNPSIIYAGENGVCDVYGLAMNRTLEEERKESDPRTQRAIANAELICRAVNSHDALVEALFRTQNVIRGTDVENVWMNHPIKPSLGLGEVIDAALALAGEGNSVPSATEKHPAAPVIP